MGSNGIFPRMLAGRKRSVLGGRLMQGRLGCLCNRVPLVLIQEDSQGMLLIGMMLTWFLTEGPIIDLRTKGILKSSPGISSPEMKWSTANERLCGVFRSVKERTWAMWHKTNSTATPLLARWLRERCLLNNPDHMGSDPRASWKERNNSRISLASTCASWHFCCAFTDNKCSCVVIFLNSGTSWQGTSELGGIWN